MKTIVIDARLYGPEHTGLGRYTMNVMQYLPGYLKKYQVKILLPDRYARALTFPPHCTVVRCDFAHYSLAEQLFLPLLLARLQADLLITFHFNVPIFSPVPKLVTVHDLIKSFFTGADTTTRNPWLYRLKRWGYNLVVARALTQAQAIVVPTNTVKNDILSLYGGVKPERIHPIPEAPDAIFRTNLKFENLRFEIPQKYLLFVGNAYPHKNLGVLLLALAQLRNLHLVIVSKQTPFLARILATTPDQVKKRITIFSQLSDPELVAVYRQASLLVTPSLMEGYGLVGLEAMMVGTPVIASDISVYREVYGTLVTYFNPHDSRDLAAKIRQVLRLPKSSRLPMTRTWSDVAKAFAEVVHESSARL
jgi:glycosyltransferase involved in cell wall biosynthesis